MKIVVISDTHGDLSALRRVALIEYDADLYLHAGDVEASSGHRAFCRSKRQLRWGVPGLPVPL